MFFRLAVIFLAGYVLVTQGLPDRNTVRSELNWLEYSVKRNLGLDRIDRIERALSRR